LGTLGHFAGDLHAVDPFLEGTTEAERIDLLAVFARYIREGHAGRGHQVRSGSVQDALCAVGKIFELDRQPNPLYQVGAYKHYWEPLRSILECYK
jgi:hypothetical protein